MKQFILLLVIALMPYYGMAQTDTANHKKDSTSATDTSLKDSEAGGIPVTENPDTVSDTQPSNGLNSIWSGMAIGAVVSIVFMYFTFRKNKAKVQEIAAIQQTETANTKSTNTPDPKSKAEIKALMSQIKALQENNATLEQHIQVYRDFDSGYYDAAFKKLISPLNDAMEKGSRKEILESLLKISSHFSSLTRYKLSKKQPYDEMNMQYLMNSKPINDNMAPEINSETAIDKIPKNIKTIMDMMKEADARSLDDSVIAGYRIKNIA